MCVSGELTSACGNSQTNLHAEALNSFLGPFRNMVLPGDFHAYSFPRMVFLDLKFKRHLNGHQIQPPAFGQRSFLL